MSHKQTPDLTPLQPLPHHPRTRNFFILKSLTIIITLTILVLLINYYLISNCPKDNLQEASTLSRMSTNAITTHVTNTQVTISVYYEVLCPDSKSFILNQLVPVQRKYGHHVNVRYVPFGKASVTKPTDVLGEFRFNCQHGPEECHGNKLHSCLLESYPTNQSLITSIIACSMSKYRLWGTTINSITEMTTECRQKYIPTDTSPVLCPNASRLLASHGYETLGLNPRASFIPTISIEGSHANQAQILRDLDTVICKSLKHRTEINC